MAAAAGSSLAVGSSVAASSLLTQYPVMSGQALRYAMGTGVLAIIARRRLPRLRRREIPRLIALAGTGLAGFNIFLVYALRNTDPGTVGAIIGGVPVVLALAGPLRARRRPSKRMVLAAVAVSVGAATMQWTGALSSPQGLVLAIGAMLCEAAFSLLALPLLRTLGPLGLSTYVSFTGACLMFLGALIQDGANAVTIPTVKEIGALIYLAIVVTAGAFFMWYSSLERIATETAGLFAGIVPIVALLTSLFVGTTLATTGRVVGALIVGVGVIFGVTEYAMQPKRPVMDSLQLGSGAAKLKSQIYQGR